MHSRQLANTEEVVTRLVGMPPPLIPLDLAGTRMTPRWRNPPFEGRLPGFKDHVIVAHLGGYSDSSVRTDGRLCTAGVGQGAVSICPSGRDTARRSAGTIEVTSIFLDPDRLQSCSDQLGSSQASELLDRLGFDDPKLFAIMTLLYEELRWNEILSRLFVEHLVDALCLQLLRVHSSLSVPTGARPRRGLAAWQVRRVTAYMRDHIGQDIGLQQLADHLRLSRFHFCTAFRNATGYTPHAWLTRLRMELARKLLADPALRITDITLAVGYETSSAFAASFRRHVGVTPTAFRRSL